MSVDVTALLNEERKTEDNSCEIEFQIFEGDQDDPEGDEASLQMAGTIFAHKAVLRMRSSVFKRQFFGALRRNGTDSLREVVKIKRCTFIGFGSLMESVYGNFEDVDKIVDFHILFDVIKLADRYDIQDVFEHVKLRIENFKLSSSSAFEVLKVLFVNKNLAGFSEICENGGKRVAELLHSELDCVGDLVDLLYDGYQNESPMVVEWLVSNLREIDEDFTPNEKEWLEKVDKLESAKRSKRSLKRKIEDLEDSKARSTEKIRKLEQDVLDIRAKSLEDLENQAMTHTVELLEEKQEIYWLKSKLKHNNSRCYNCNMDLASCLDDQAIDISKVSSVAQGCHVWDDYYCHSVKRISFMRNRAEGNFIELDNNKKVYMDRNGKTVIRFKCRCNCELGE